VYCSFNIKLHNNNIIIITIIIASEQWFTKRNITKTKTLEKINKTVAK